MIKHNRQSIRMKSFDYSSDGYYFVTLCTHNKELLFGKVDQLNELGRIAESELLLIPSRFEFVNIERYVIMPNHIHVIFAVKKANKNGVESEKKARLLLGNIVGLYKSGVTRKIHLKMPGLKVWQRLFYEHIIRNVNDYTEISKYVYENPQRWLTDRFYKQTR